MKPTGSPKGQEISIEPPRLPPSCASSPLEALRLASLVQLGPRECVVIHTTDPGHLEGLRALLQSECVRSERVTAHWTDYTRTTPPLRVALMWLSDGQVEIAGHRWPRSSR